MKQISNKEYEKYQQYQTDKLHGRILTPDGLRIRNGISKNGTDPVQSGMVFFILQSNILIDRLRLYTIVILTLSTELSAAFWAFPLFILCIHAFVISLQTRSCL